jgi:predicted dehydrogenase
VGADDSVASATLSYADGRTAHVHVARFAAEKLRRVSIAGTRHTLTFDELAPEHPLQISESAGAGLTRISVDTIDPLLAQCAHFVACVGRGDPAGGNGAHALAVVKVLAAGARSMRATGAPIAV